MSKRYQDMNPRERVFARLNDAVDEYLDAELNQDEDDESVEDVILDEDISIDDLVEAFHGALEGRLP